MNEREITIDISEIWKALRKGKAIIAFVTLVAVVLAGIYVLVVTPTYQSTTLLRIKKPQGIGSSLLDVASGGNSGEAKQRMSTYAEILKSRSVVEPVIKTLEEEQVQGVNPNYELYVKNHITTVPLKDTEIMQVQVTANTAKDAQNANNLLVDSFLKRLTTLSRGEQKATRSFLEGRLASAKKELLADEQKLTDFKKEHKVLAPTSQIQLAADKLSMADKLKAENQIALEAASAKEATINGQLKGNTASIAGNNVLKGLQTQLAELETKRIQLLAQYTEQHPDVVQVNQDIAGVRKAMDAEIQKIAAMQAPSDNSLFQSLLAEKFKSEAEKSVAEGNLAAIAGIEAQYKNDVSNLSDTEQTYLNLMRDVTVAQDIYTMLAKRLEEAKVAEAAVVTDVQVVDKAPLPEKPIKPRKGLVLGLAFIIGLLLSSAGVIANAILNRRIATAEDVEQYLDLPVLGQIPYVHDDDDEEETGFLQKLAWWKR